MEYIQYILVGITVAAAIIWLLRKRLFPKKYTSSGCNDGDCSCH